MTNCRERCYIEAILNPQQTISKECLWPARCELPSLGRSITSPLVATKERLCLRATGKRPDKDLPALRQLIVLQTACLARGSEPKLTETCRLLMICRLWRQINATRFTGGCLLKAAAAFRCSSQLHVEKPTVRQPYLPWQAPN